MAYAHVQTVAGNGTFPITIASTGAGNTLIVAINWSDSAVTLPTLTGYTAVGTKVTDGNNISSQVFYQENISSGVTSVAIASWSNGTPGTLFGFASEYSGLATSGSLITFARQAIASPGAGTDLATSGSVSVGTAPALIYSMGEDAVLSTAFATGTANSPTSRATDSNNGRVQDYRITGTGSNAGTFTANPANATVWMVAFSEPGTNSMLVGAMCL